MVGNITMMAMVILVVLVVMVVVLLRQLTMVEVVEDVKMPLVQVDKKFFFNFFFNVGSQFNQLNKNNFISLPGIFLRLFEGIKRNSAFKKKML